MADDDDIIVEVWDDPIWSPALKALQDEGNVQLLANLLRDCGKHPPPFEVTNELGKMLQPPKGYGGRKLKVISPKKGFEYRLSVLAREVKIRRSLEEATARLGKREAAIQEVMQQFRLGRAKLFELLSRSARDVVLEAEILLGNAQAGEEGSANAGPNTKSNDESTTKR
jgi:hypothetical protein